MAIVLLGIGPAAAQGRAASVLVEEVDIRATSDTSPIIGQLVPSTQTDVASRRPGVTVEVLFKVGDRVAGGDPLVRLATDLQEIERSSGEAALEVAEAGVSAAEARLALALQGLARQERLKRSSAFSQGAFEDLQRSVEQAQSELAQANAEIRSARARLARVSFDLEQSIIRAPFNGVVIERMAQPGQYLNIGEAVAKLLDIDALEIEADVPTELIAGLTPRTEVTILFASGERGTATVRVALPVETISTRTRPVRFRTDLSGIDPQLIAVGKSLTLQIPVSAPRELLTVPKDALVQGPGGSWIVYVVVDGVAKMSPIKLGQAAGARMEVVSGLSPGDMVVVRGNERLRPDQPVNATPAGG
ncbi:MAG: efflux RND transporter periplasmic adaptor subunit [Pseudomonadota bacterium]